MNVRLYKLRGRVDLAVPDTSVACSWAAGLSILVALFLLLVSASAVALDADGATDKFVDYWNLGESRAAQDLEVFEKEFISSRGTEGLARLMKMLYSDSGNISVHHFDNKSDEQVRFFVSSEKGNWLDISLDFLAGGSGRISGMSVSFAPEPAGDGDKNLNDSQIVAKLEKYLADQFRNDAFTGSVILAKNFKSIYSQSFGQANRSSAVVNNLDTPINMGSMNKMFTGLAITQLAASGRLQYEDTVGEHLPEYPDPEVRDKVTIHQLLTHTSGLDSYWNDEYESNKNSLETVQDFADLFEGDPLQFEPGDRFHYSNVGPVVLGLIIEAITGQNYYDYIREKVYAPAGMTRCDHYDKFEAISGKAQGYYVPEGQQDLVSNQESLGRIGSPAGGGYCSANDLLRFAEALNDGRLINDEYLQVMTTNQTGSVNEDGYGYLYMSRWIEGKRFYGHTGGAPGINAVFSELPEFGYTVIVLSNLDRGAMDVANHIHQWIAHARQ
jgi:CubicO group peptidase (beta-lactamase class C family)